VKRSIVAFLKGIIPVIVALVFVVSVSACQKEGTMEKAGKKIDEGIETTKDAMKEAGDKAKDTMEKAGQEVDKAVDATKDTMKEAAEKVKEGVEETKEAVKDTAKKTAEKTKK
jgi:gas vesicle protein